MIGVPFIGSSSTDLNEKKRLVSIDQTSAGLQSGKKNKEGRGRSCHTHTHTHTLGPHGGERQRYYWTEKILEAAKSEIKKIRGGACRGSSGSTGPPGRRSNTLPIQPFSACDTIPRSSLADRFQQLKQHTSSVITKENRDCYDECGRMRLYHPRMYHPAASIGRFSMIRAFESRVAAKTQSLVNCFSLVIFGVCGNWGVELHNSTGEHGVSLYRVCLFFLST